MSSKSIVRNQDHYWDTIIFQVEDELFKVPRYHFQKELASPFAAMLSLPQGNLVPEGGSDRNPVVLEGISKIDFSRLLHAMYPINLDKPVKMSEDGWISVLKLSHKYQLLDVRKASLRELAQNKISCIDKIILGRECEIVEWLIAGYVELVNQEQKVSIDDASAIGFEAAILISHAREDRIANQRDGINTFVAQNAVWDLFREELKGHGGVETRKPQSSPQSSPFGGVSRAPFGARVSAFGAPTSPLRTPPATFTFGTR
ncbi:hypothetical protein C8J56DRAFT_1022688 [Mycena floridula]|nr:hypothetical protein C8J56DRAFT_1022688 [Mycena floridula]